MRELVRLWVVLIPRWKGRHPRDWEFARRASNGLPAAYETRKLARLHVKLGEVQTLGGRYRIEGLWADAIGKGRTQ